MTQDEYNNLAAILEGKAWEVRTKLLQYLPHIKIRDEVTDTRSSAQNRALHLYFTQVAQALNDAGLDMRAVIKPEVDIPWSSTTVKEYLWRPIQKLATQKESSRTISKEELTQVWEIFNRHIAKHGIHVPFPHDQGVMLTAMENLNNEAYPEYTGAPTI